MRERHRRGRRADRASAARCGTAPRRLVTARYLDRILTSFPGLPAAISFFVPEAHGDLAVAALVLARRRDAWRAPIRPAAAPRTDRGHAPGGRHVSRQGQLPLVAPLLIARDLCQDYPMNGETVHALRGVSLSVAAGEYVAIVGPSGCGKSTLLQLARRTRRPDRRARSRSWAPGSITLSDRELTRLRLTRLGFVFQRFHLLPVLTAAENIELPMAEAGVHRAERRARAAELLGYVGLAHRAGHRATELSGGEMQRVAIARALANRPALVLADEPTGELDAATGREILTLFRRLNQDGMTLRGRDPRRAAGGGGGAGGADAGWADRCETERPGAGTD